MKRQATWSNCFGIILQFTCIPSNSAPSQMSWRNACTSEPGGMCKNVYYIFIIAKKLEITLCPSTGKWLHSGIEYNIQQ